MSHIKAESTTSGPTVVQLNLSGAWGGMEMSTLKTAKGLAERGCRSLIVTLKGAQLVDEAKKEGLEVFELTSYGYLSISSSWRLHRILKTYQVSTVMVHQLRNLWILRPALWGTSQVRVIGFARMFLKNINKKDFLHRYVYGSLQYLVSLSQTQKQALTHCLPVPNENYRVIPNGVDCQKFHPQNRNLKIRQIDFEAGESEVVIGVIGRLDIQKGQLELLQAFHKIVQKYSCVKLIIVGDETMGQSGYREKLVQYVFAHQLEDKVRFLGHRTDTPLLMASFDVFVMPSYEEAFGNVLIEAMASGVPVIATSRGGALDIVEPGWGVFAEPQSSQSLFEALENLIQNEGLRRSMGQSGRGAAVSKYALPLVMDQIRDLVL